MLFIELISSIPSSSDISTVFNSNPTHTDDRLLNYLRIVKFNKPLAGLNKKEVEIITAQTMSRKFIPDLLKLPDGKTVALETIVRKPLQEEIARALDMSLSTYKRILKSARTKIRSNIEQ